MDLWRDYPVTFEGNTFILRKIRTGCLLFHGNRLINRSSKANCIRWAKQIAKANNAIHTTRTSVQEGVQLEL